LKCRARWVDAGDHLVGQRLARIVGKLLPHRRGEPGREWHRIETRARDESQDIAGERIEQDARDALLGAAAAGDELLHRHVDTGDCVLPGLSGYAGEVTDDPAEGIDFDLARPCRAAQLQILRLLDATLADAEIRHFEQRIAIEFLLGYCGDIADDVRRGLAEGVVACHALVDR
jgi:hypothetical protein